MQQAGPITPHQRSRALTGDGLSSTSQPMHRGGEEPSRARPPPLSNRWKWRGLGSSPHMPVEEPCAHPIMVVMPAAWGCGGGVQRLLRKPGIQSMHCWCSLSTIIFTLPPPATWREKQGRNY